MGVDSNQDTGNFRFWVASVAALKRAGEVVYFCGPADLSWLAVTVVTIEALGQDESGEELPGSSGWSELLEGCKCDDGIAWSFS